MLTLVALSVISWAIIIQRRKTLGHALSSAKKFESRFWSGVDLSKLYSEISARGNKSEGLEALFTSGFKEFARHKKNNVHSAGMVTEGAHRAMRVDSLVRLRNLRLACPFLQP